MKKHTHTEKLVLKLQFSENLVYNVEAYVPLFSLYVTEVHGGRHHIDLLTYFLQAWSVSSYWKDLVNFVELSRKFQYINLDSRINLSGSSSMLVCNTETWEFRVLVLWILRWSSFCKLQAEIHRCMHTITSTLRTLGKIFRGRHIEIVSHFSQKTGFDISCKLSPMKTICMTCQTLIFLVFFGWKIRKLSPLRCLLNFPRQW